MNDEKRRLITRICTILGFLSGFISSLINDYFFYIDLRNSYIEFSDRFVLTLFMFLFMLIFICPIITGFGLVTGLILTSTLENKWKYTIFICECVQIGLWVFMYENPIKFWEKIPIEGLILALSSVSIFVFLFLLFLLPYFFLTLRKQP
jgi:hypothetical protein